MQNQVLKNKNEIISSAAHQVARIQQNEDEEELRNNKRSIRNKISELLEGRGFYLVLVSS